MFLLDMFSKKMKIPAPEDALPGRSEPSTTAERHFVSGQPIKPPFPEGLETAIFGLGCFWGAERIFWKTQGVFSTAVGFTAGVTPNPTYHEVCTGQTGHNEAVLVVFDPAIVPYPALLKLFFESHNPTQGMRQGNDMGTQYRSGIYVTSPAQRAEAEAAKEAYRSALSKAGHRGEITTEILDAPGFFYAEESHQQYLAKNPNGYCGLGGTGIACPIAQAAVT